jgi:excisionase family DNA binding protein
MSEKKSGGRDLNKEKFLRPEEVARMFGVHERTIWRWLQAKKLPGCKIGRTWIISRAHLDSYIEGRISARMKR